MDFRGHGETRPLGPPEKIGMAVLADDLLAFLDGLGIGQAVVGGSSMGAAVALNVGLRFPQRLRALILYRPCWIDRPLPANPPGLRERCANSRAIRSDGRPRAVSSVRGSIRIFSVVGLTSPARSWGSSTTPARKKRR